MLSMLVALALSQNTATMAGLPPRALSVDFTQAILRTLPAPCAGAAVTNEAGGAVTVSRANVAYCQGTDGLYSIGNNLPAVEADGLRVEPASSNRIADSTQFLSTWTTVSNTTIVSDDEDTPQNPVDQEQTARKITSTVNGGYNESPVFTITATSAVASLFARTSSGTQAYAFVLRDTTANADRCTGTATATTAYPSMDARTSCAASGTIVSGNNHVLRIYPGGTGGQGTIVFWGPQVEPTLTTMTSFIATGGGAASRAADVVSTTITDFSTAGCIRATIRPMSPGFPQRIFTHSADLAAFNNTVSIFTGDGTNTINSPNVSNMTGRSVPLRVQWGASGLRADLDGSLGTAGSFDGAHGAGTTLGIGNNSGVQVFHGWFKNIKVSTDPAGCSP